ncbi:MAG: hypothetical protein V1692_00445 [bacterium]
MAIKKTKIKANQGKIKKAASQIAEDQFISQTLEKRRRLMWLGVGISTTIIFILWIFSWQVNYPSLSKNSQPSPETAKLKEITDSLAGVIAETKNSLANIEQTSAENKDQNQAEQDLTNKLKDEVLNKLEENNNQEESASESPVIIFKDNE